MHSTAQTTERVETSAVTGARPWGKWAVNALTVGLCTLWAIPIIWALIVSVRPPNDNLGPGDVWFSDSISFESYERAVDLAPFFPTIEDGELTSAYYINTLQYVGMTLIVQVFTVTLAAFAFVNFEFPGKRILFYMILLQMMIPTAILLVPNFITIRELGLYDTTLAIAIPYFGSAFGTFLMRQAFLSVPQDLVDSGQIDGCNWYQLLWHVYLPPSRATLVAFAMVGVSFHWSSLLWPLVVTTNDARPLTMGLLRFTEMSDIGAQWSLVMAATIIIVGPLLIAFLIFQKQFIKSFMHSGLK